MPLKRVIVLFILIGSGLCGFLFSLHLHHAETTLPTDTTIETFHYPALFVKQLAGDPLAGEKIFKEFCASCHSPQPLIDVKAPRVGDRKAWEIRRKLGMDALMQITLHGIGAMPARGGCFECSDAQLRATIQYILAYPATSSSSQ